MKTSAFVLGLALVALIAPLPAGSADRRAATYPCGDQLGFSNTTLLIVTTVTPAAGKVWSFDSAPSVIAARILSDLNANPNNITFKEASGVVPNLYLNVTMSETNTGTQQDQAWISVTGLGKPGVLFSESSGAAPYIGWHDAIDHLVTNALVWIDQGWHTNPPCRRPDGSMRTQWPDTGGGSARSK